MKRRNFLSILGLASIYPTSKVVQNISQSTFFNDNNNQSKKYVLFNVMEAPARWMFDSILKPTKDHEFITHNLIPTNFKKMNTKVYDFEYEYLFHPIKGYQFPHMWGYDMPSSRGLNIPFKNLSENMLIVRGCDMILDGHEICSKKLEAPMAGENSICGMHDHNTSPLFGCINLEGTKEAGTAPQAYASPSRSSTNIARQRNYAQYILDPFIENERSDLLDSILGDALKNEKSSSLLGIIKARKIKKSALARLKKDITLIIKTYDESVIKYQKLIDQSIQNTNLKGITDKPIPGLKFPITLNRKFHKDSKEYKIEDYLGTYKEMEYLLLDDDIRSIFKDAKIREFAKQMAMTEVSLIFDLSNSLIVNIDTITSLKSKIWFGPQFSRHF